MKKKIRLLKQKSFAGYKARKKFVVGMFAVVILILIACVFAFCAPISSLAVLAFAPLAFIDKAKDPDKMTDEEKSVIGTFNKAIDDSFKEIEKSMGESTLEKAKQAIKEELEKLKNENAEIVKGLAKQIDEFKEKSVGLGDNKNELRKSIEDALNSKKFDEFVSQHVVSVKEMPLKGLKRKAISMTSDYTGTILPAMQTNIVTPEAQPGINNIRSVVNAIDASADGITSLAFLKITDIDRNAAAVAENGVLPAGSFKMVEVNVPCQRIGWHIPISRRMLRTKSLLVNYIMQIMPNGLSDSENFQIIFGDGDGYNVSGIIQDALTETSLYSTVKTLTNADYTAANVYTKYNTVATPTQTKFTFDTAFSKVKTGMKVTITGVVNATTYNSTFDLIKVNDNSFIIPFYASSSVPATDFANATFTIANAFADTVDFANAGDVVEACVASQTFAMYRPTGILMNPTQLFAIKALKDYNGNKIGDKYVEYVNGAPFIAGIPVIEIACIPKGKVLIGDFTRGCTLADTQNAFLEFSEDTTAKIGNYVEAIIQEEVIFAVTVPDAFLYADIATLITQLDSGRIQTTNVNITAPLNTAGDAVAMEAAS
jgi:hypothetical protein